MRNCLWSLHIRGHSTNCKQQYRGFQGAHGPGYRGLLATTWDPMGARVPVLSPNDHPPKAIPRATEGFQKNANFENFSSVTQQPTQQQFWGFWGGGGIVWATWAQRLLHGSPWVLKYPYCDQVITQTSSNQILEATEWFQKKSSFEKFYCLQHYPKQCTPKSLACTLGSFFIPRKQQPKLIPFDIIPSSSYYSI